MGPLQPVNRTLSSGTPTAEQKDCFTRVLKENEFGMRIENVALVVKDEAKSSQDLTFFKFETITLCPIDLRLVKEELLSGPEIDWLNSYHRKIYKALAPFLDIREAEWLEKATIEI
jgi:Xaa-Pro aminopeptidase